MAQILARLLLILICVFSIGCGTGTETGNPTNLPGADAPESPGTTGADNEAADADPISSDCPPGTDETVLEELVERLCLEIFLCDNSIGTLFCIAALRDSAAELFTVDEDEVLSCQDDIAMIDCDEINMNVSEGEFSMVENIIPDSCRCIL